MSRTEPWRELDLKLPDTRIFLSTYFAPWSAGLPIPYSLFATKVISELESFRCAEQISTHFGIPFVEDPDAFVFQNSFLLPRRRDQNGNTITFALWLQEKDFGKVFDPKPVPVLEDSQKKVSLLRKSTFSSLVKRSWLQWQDIRLRKTNYYVATAALGLIAEEDKAGAKEQARLYFDRVDESGLTKIGGVVTLTSDSLVGFQALRLEIDYQEIVIMGLLDHILKQEHDLENLDLTQINTFGLRYGSQLTPTLPSLAPRFDPFSYQNLLYSAVVLFAQKRMKAHGRNDII